MSGISTHLKKGSMKLEAPKKMAVMYDLRGIFWSTSCLVFSTKIIKLQQMRWVHISSECPLYIM
jgi:hypothetical protein